jgi:hypothetical protein
MVMSWDLNAGKNHNIKTGNKSFERVEQFKYLGTTLTNQNYIQEEIKSRFKSRNACCHSVRNLLSSRLLSTNIRLRYREIKFCLFFCTWVKLDLSQSGKSLGWGYLRIGCWIEYLGLRGTR